MSRATPAMRRSARCIIECDAKGGKSSTAKISTVAFPVPEKLRQPLAALMGDGGFRALVSRALALATVEVRWLRTVRVKANGALDGTEAIQTQVDPAEFREGRVVLLAQLLGLLVAFIGPRLTSRMVREIWPKISPGELELGTEDKK